MLDDIMYFAGLTFICLGLLGIGLVLIAMIIRLIFNKKECDEIKKLFKY
jgi:hypothetical protein